MSSATRSIILIVDDEPRSLDAIRRTLDDDYEVLQAGSADEARAILQRRDDVSVILCDQRMPGQSGVDFLKEVRELWPDCVRIIISGYSDSEDIIAGVNEAGLYQYLLKPWMPDHLLNVVRAAVQARDAQQGIARLDLELRRAPNALQARREERTRRVADAYAFAQLLRAPRSPLDDVCVLAERVAVTSLSVLLQGESGTGKELLARAIHYASPRLQGPFEVENCAALADTLLESELFGHRRGAFTGAIDDHVGLFQRAQGGTVFLDEIGETSPLFQVKLLRVLEAREVRPVGSTRAIPVDVRVICATHRDLEEEVRAGRFREDLYYRIAEFTLALPALRERVGDIPLIAQRMLDDLARSHGRPAMRLDDDALKVLAAYSWPGNVRELRNEMGRAMALSDRLDVSPAVFSRKVRQNSGISRADGTRTDGARTDGAGSDGVRSERARPEGASRSTGPAVGTLQQRLDAYEAGIIRETMLRLFWHRTQAAQELGISRVGLRAKLIRFGLEKESP